MSQYTDIEIVKDLGSMPAEDIDALEVLYPGITNRLAIFYSGKINARLRKRYATPFADVPDTPVGLLICASQLVAYRLWLKRGFNPRSEHNQAIRDDYQEARDWLIEAADGQDGLIELPLRETDPPAASGVDQGGPLGYSEASPYTWTTRQLQGIGYE